jgi:hypothetical protein
MLAYALGEEHQQKEPGLGQNTSRVRTNTEASLISNITELLRELSPTTEISFTRQVNPT